MCARRAVDHQTCRQFTKAEGLAGQDLRQYGGEEGCTLRQDVQHRAAVHQAGGFDDHSGRDFIGQKDASGTQHQGHGRRRAGDQPRDSGDGLVPVVEIPQPRRAPVQPGLRPEPFLRPICIG